MKSKARFGESADKSASKEVLNSKLHPVDKKSGGGQKPAVTKNLDRCFTLA